MICILSDAVANHDEYGETAFSDVTEPGCHTTHWINFLCANTVWMCEKVRPSTMYRTLSKIQLVLESFWDTKMTLKIKRYEGTV